MINLNKIQEAKKSGNTKNIKKEIANALQTIESAIRLIETSLNTLEANRFHFCKKLLKIADKFNALQMIGARDQCISFSEKFDTEDPFRLSELTLGYQIFISPQYKSLEKLRDELKYLKEALV